MSKNELKKLVQRVCVSEYGFAPSKSQIVLLESDGIGHYIMFSVCDVSYVIHYMVYTDTYLIEKTFNID